jgi:phospholipid transport system transporter-binding protein
LNSAHIATSGKDNFRVSGKLTFATVRDALQASHQLFAQATALNIDLSEVSVVDSAGLALLIEWYRRASKTGKPISFIAVPKQLSALAKISDVDQFLVL